MAQDERHEDRILTYALPQEARRMVQRTSVSGLLRDGDRYAGEPSHYTRQGFGGEGSERDGFIIPPGLTPEREQDIIFSYPRMEESAKKVLYCTLDSLMAGHCAMDDEGTVYVYIIIEDYVVRFKGLEPTPRNLWQGSLEIRRAIGFFGAVLYHSEKKRARGDGSVFWVKKTYRLFSQEQETREEYRRKGAVVAIVDPVAFTELGGKDMRAMLYPSYVFSNPVRDKLGNFLFIWLLDNFRNISMAAQGNNNRAKLGTLADHALDLDLLKEDKDRRGRKYLTILATLKDMEERSGRDFMVHAEIPKDCPYSADELTSLEGRGSAAKIPWVRELVIVYSFRSQEPYVKRALRKKREAEEKKESTARQAQLEHERAVLRAADPRTRKGGVLPEYEEPSDWVKTEARIRHEQEKLREAEERHKQGKT